MAKAACFLVVLCLLVGVIRAGEEPTGDDFDIWVEDDSTEENQNVALIVAAWRTEGYTDSQGNPADVQAWSWGMCHDENLALIGDCGAISNPDDPAVPTPVCTSCDHIACPADMTGPGPNGEDPDFHSVNVYPGGVTQGLVLSFFQAWELESTDRFEMMRVTYDLFIG